MRPPMEDIPSWVIALIVIILVLAFNFSLAWGALRAKPRKAGLFGGRSFGEMLNPWREEDRALDELRRQVEELSPEDRDAPQHDPPN